MDLSIFYNRKSRFVWLVAIMLIPLFFINVRNSHDWGGDFAMYIMQAENIVKGIPQADNLYIYNPDNACLAHRLIPLVFHCCSARYMPWRETAFLPSHSWITAFLFGIGMMMALYLRRYFSELITFFLVMIVVYNPWTLGMKLEIMSEFPFTFLLLLCLLLFEKYAKGPFWMGIIIAVLGGLLMSVRMIGVVFPLAVLIWAIRKRFIEKDKTPMSKCVCGFLVGVGLHTVSIFF